MDYWLIKVVVVKQFGTPGLRIETYQQRIDNEFWLVEGTQMKISEGSGCWIGDRKEWVGSWKRRGKDSQLKTRDNNVKTADSCSPNVGLSSNKGSHTRHAAVETKPANKHVRIKQKTRKKIQGPSLLSFSLRYFVSLYLAYVVDRVFIRCSSPADD